MAKHNYINNKELEQELILFNETYMNDRKRLEDEGLPANLAKKKARGHISEDLGMMFYKIATNYINKPSFNRYTYRDEMVSQGIEYLCRFAKTFDKTKNNANGFAYCTRICHNAFVQFIKKEGKQSEMKDKIIKEAMLEKEIEKWAKKQL
jgi:hypothetical protein